MHSLDFLEKAVSLSSKEFIRGFLIGQLALLLTLLLLARFLFFRSPDPTTPIRFPSRKAKAKKMKLETHEEISTAGRESCEWVNSLLAKLLAPLRMALADSDNLESISSLLNGYVRQNEMLGTVEILKFEFCDSHPLVRWVEYFSDGYWEVKMEWSDVATLDLDTAVLLSWPPNQRLASLPCSFAFSVRSIMATLRIELQGQQVYVSAIGEDFELDLEVHSLVGHRTKLKDIPKLTSVLRERIKKTIGDKLIHPNRIEFNAGDLFKKTFLPPIKTVD